MASLAPLRHLTCHTRVCIRAIRRLGTTLLFVPGNWGGSDVESLACLVRCCPHPSRSISSPIHWQASQTVPPEPDQRHQSPRPATSRPWPVIFGVHPDRCRVRSYWGPNPLACIDVAQ